MPANFSMELATAIRGAAPAARPHHHRRGGDGSGRIYGLESGPSGGLAMRVKRTMADASA